MIDKEIRVSNALRIYCRLIYLTDVFHIFERNYYDFNKLLMAYNTPQAILAFFGDEDKDDFHLINNELNRYFHNYVTSAQTLAAHTRIMIERNYKNLEFINEYHKKR